MGLKELFCQCMCHHFTDDQRPGTKKPGCCGCKVVVRNEPTCSCLCHGVGSEVTGHVSYKSGMCQPCLTSYTKHLQVVEQRSAEMIKALKLTLKRGDRIAYTSDGMLPFIIPCDHVWAYIRNTRLDEMKNGKQYEIYHCIKCLRHCKIEWEWPSEIETLPVRPDIEE